MVMRTTASDASMLPSPRQTAHDASLRRTPAGGNEVGVRCSGAGECGLDSSDEIGDGDNDRGYHG